MIDPYNDDYFMQQALLEAKKAFEKNEVPVGAVIVSNKQVIARAHNLTEQLTDVTAHAEIQAITAASQFLGAKYSKDAMYVTLEPCKMCAGALYWSQIDKIVYGARDEKEEPDYFHHHISSINPCCKWNKKEDCQKILKSFLSLKKINCIKHL